MQPVFSQDIIPFDTTGPFRYLSEFDMEHYDASTGFAQNSIHGIYKDKNGFIWLNNYAGLSSFDGLNFEHYSGPQLTPGTIGVLGFGLWVPERKKDILQFPPKDKQSKRLYKKAQGEPRFWDETIQLEFPPDYDSTAGDQLYWEVDSACTYFMCGKFLHVKADGEWKAYQINFNNNMELGQLTPIDQALFVFDKENLLFLEFRGGLLVGSYQLPEKTWSNLHLNDLSSNERGGGGDSYYQFGKYYFKLITDVPGKPFMKLLYKGDLELPLLRSMFVDSISGNIFIGGLSDGVYRLTEKAFVHSNWTLTSRTKENKLFDVSKALEEWKNQNSNFSKTPKHLISLSKELHLFAQEDHGLWINDDNKWQVLGLDAQGHLKDALHVEQSQHYLWILTSKGLLQCDKSEFLKSLPNQGQGLYYKYYDLNSNLKPDSLILQVSANGQPFLKMGDANFVINPKHLAKPERLEIFIKSLKVNDQSELGAEPLVLDREFGEVELSFSIPYFLNRNNLQVQYSLDGNGGHWHDLDLKDKLRFQQLDPGDYRLTIRAREGFGDNPYYERIIHFEVLPFWYESLGFRLFVISLILLIALLGYRSRIKSIRENKKQLSLLIKVKKSELEELNNSLTLNNLKLNKSKRDQERSFAERDEIVNLYTEKLREPLIKIIENLDQLDGEENHTGQSSQDTLKYIQNKSSSTYILTESYFNWIREKEGLVQNTRIEIYLKEIIDEMTSSYREQLSERKLEVHNHIPKDQLLFSEPNAFNIVLDIFINNAIKYSKNGTISFQAESQQNHTVLSIKDQGVGMDKSQLKRVQEGSNQGYGISAARQLMDRIGAYLEIQSEPGKGTEVLLFFKSVEP